MKKSNGKPRTNRKELEKFVHEEFVILKQEFSESIQQMFEQIKTFKEDIGIAKTLSIINSRIIFDMAAGREIKLTETEHGKTVDREYYIRQFRAVEDMDAFITGKVVDEEKLNQFEEDVKNRIVKQKLDEWISEIVRLGGETKLRKAHSDEDLVEFLKIQRVGMDWEEEMEQFSEEVYNKNTNRLVETRKKILEQSVKFILLENGMGFSHHEGFLNKIKSSALKRLEHREFLWRDEILDWVPAIVEDLENQFEKDGKELIEKAKELSSEWEQDYNENINELTQHIANREYMKAMQCYAKLSEDVGKRKHQESIS